MKTEELRAVVKDWKNEDKDRTVIMIVSERLGGGYMESNIMIEGNKLNVLLTMFNFMEGHIDMMTEAAKIGAMNELIGDLMGNIPPEKLDKNKDAFFKLIKDLEKLHTKHS